MPDVTFDIVSDCELWPDEKTLAKLTRRISQKLDGITAGHVTYVFSDDSMVQVLNREWRGFDKPTNVLSFPDGDEEDGVIHLGDVILAHETLTRESEEMGVSFDDHLTHLILHGTLHLAGYDHENEADAKTMENLETRILGELEIKDPYQDSTDALD